VHSSTRLELDDEMPLDPINNLKVILLADSIRSRLLSWFGSPIIKKIPEYSKTCEIRPPLGWAKSGLISEVALFHRMGQTKQPNGPPSALQLKTTTTYYLLFIINIP
jgi:hypothetical protein